jgi:hypothetical protein
VLGYMHLLGFSLAFTDTSRNPARLQWTQELAARKRSRTLGKNVPTWAAICSMTAPPSNDARSPSLALVSCQE